MPRFGTTPSVSNRSFSTLKRQPAHLENDSGHPASPRSLLDDAEIFSNRRRCTSTRDYRRPTPFEKHFHEPRPRAQLFVPNLTRAGSF